MSYDGLEGVQESWAVFQGFPADVRVFGLSFLPEKREGATSDRYLPGD